MYQNIQTRNKTRDYKPHYIGAIRTLPRPHHIQMVSQKAPFFFCVTSFIPVTLTLRFLSKYLSFFLSINKIKEKKKQEQANTSSLKTGKSSVPIAKAFHSETTLPINHVCFMNSYGDWISVSLHVFCCN